MKSNQHSYEKVIDFIQQKVYLAENKSLTVQEESILKGAWDELSYEEIAESLYMSTGSIRNIAAELWQKLSRTFNQKITKKSFKLLMSKILENPDISDNYPDYFIDDDPDILETKGTILLVQVEKIKSLKQILNREGYKVKNASSGEIALTYLETNLPDLILLDIIMPQMNGYQVCKLIKENEQTK
ncbi:MAG: response regulator [Gomphosphaeria aponina SAG 52.96 = DSM 107014]|uniref:Response regulator n=1 Tax=Gomphosphaeria aponina SAG 52.96 = DSM 107014 TaxID=1521640 RepID=A0A941JUP5_9CHRO|nr:response regulator [Gomphosphaeria aponina SAG 52.96 = DSM 107014]